MDLNVYLTQTFECAGILSLTTHDWKENTAHVAATFPLQPPFETVTIAGNFNSMTIKRFSKEAEKHICEAASSEALCKNSKGYNLWEIPPILLNSVIGKFRR